MRGCMSLFTVLRGEGNYPHIDGCEVWWKTVYCINSMCGSAMEDGIVAASPACLVLVVNHCRVTESFLL